MNSADADQIAAYRCFILRSAVVLCLAFSTVVLSAQEKELLYNPFADAEKDLAAAVVEAKQQDKHVLIQIGGNWCSWCYRLHDFMASDARIDSMQKADYILIRINYSPENRNSSILARLGYPQRFGFPVLVILDQEGMYLHTQDTALLEKEDSYDAEKLTAFLQNWNAAALDPENYKSDQNQ